MPVQLQSYKLEAEKAQDVILVTFRRAKPGNSALD